MNDENDDCDHERKSEDNPKKVKRFAVKRARDIFPCDAGELRTSCDDTRKEYHRDAVADAVFINTFAEPHCKACAGSEAGDDDEAGEEACAGEVILDGNVITVCHNKRKCNCNNAGDFIQLLLTFRTALCHFFKCGDCDGKKLNNDGCCNIR